MDSSPPATKSREKLGLPSGTVAFLFTDIEGSTVRWDRDPTAMRQAVQQHDLLLKTIITEGNGYVFKALGDAFCVAFWSVDDALRASLAAQRALATHDFSAVDGMRVRMAMHVGTTDERGGDYFGPVVNRVARLLAIAHGGQVLLSSAAAAATSGELPPGAQLRDLGQHRLKDLAETERVFQLTVADLPADFPKLRSLTLETNFPQRLTGLVGRETEVATITSLLQSAPLVTLVGAGGLGKTRCALEVGSDVSESFNDGVWFADLAPLSDASLVASTIATIFDVQETPGTPLLDTLVAHLRQKNLLLVIDNCEHVIEEASHCCATILRLCPNVKLLATSREALNVAGESVFRMPSLAVPASAKGLQAADAAAYGAIELFDQRARAASPKFALNDDNAAIIADVCIRLDGIPLAIELAAARMNMLSPAQLAQRLDERFRVLTGGKRTALPRQQTMRALIDWSYDLLSPNEQWLFRQTSIFAGGFTLQPATTVAAGETIDELDVFDLLASLAAKSLVNAEPFGEETRYRLLESTRQYAREKLAAANEQERAASLHAAAYTDLAEQLEHDYESIPYQEWLERAEAEIENIRSSLTWSFGPNGEPLGALRLAATLYRVLGVFAAAEARRWVQTARERVDVATPSIILARLALGEAFLAAAFNQLRASLAAAEEALATFTTLHDERGVAEAQRLAGRSLIYMGRVDEGEQLLVESLRARREMGHSRLGGTLRDLAAVHALKGDVVQSRALLLEASAAFAEGADEGNVAITAATLAEAEYRCGDAEAALRYGEEALAEVRRLGRMLTAAAILGNIAAYLIALDRYEPAQMRAREALSVAGEAQDAISVAFALGHLSAIAALQSENGEKSLEGRTRAARLMGFVDERLSTLETAREYTEQLEYDRVISSLRDLLGADELAKLMDEGRSWTEERAIAEALRI